MGVSSQPVRSIVIACVTLAAAMGACADAPSTVTGGLGRYDAMPPELPPIPSTCGEGMTWASLYRDYFGPSSKGSCSGATGDENNCHLQSSAAGALASNGYVCGSTSDSCFASFKAVLTPAMDLGSTHYDHYFDAVLRQETPPMCPPACLSPMPLRPASAIFEKCDLDRIRAWANAGANNN